jgi:hypothetical protein
MSSILSKIKKPFLLSILIISVLVAAGELKDGQFPDVDESVKIDNQECLKCHSKSKYTFENTMTEKVERHRMCSEHQVNPEEYYVSNHKSFRCTDCHSEEYLNFPHSGELRMEPKSTCMDCHGGDEHYAKFNFEEIDKEFGESVHSNSFSEDFSCWMCHDPHSYKISARTTENIKEIIAYDNSICLSCHANLDKYQLLTDNINPNVVTSHDWLPNQKVHFSSVRCIECHTEVTNDVLVAHKIRPKAQAVKKCVECHSQNSILMTTLYKFRAKEERSKLGFFNGAILGDTFVIGANRNYYLNVISIVFMMLAFGGIAIHVLLRIIIKK